MRILSAILLTWLLLFLWTGMLYSQWIQTSLDSIYVTCFLVTGSNLYAGSSRGVYLSTDSGTTWNVINSGLTETRIRSLAANDSNLFAGTEGGGVFRSTNSGASWTTASTGLPYVVPNPWYSYIMSLATSGPNLFANTLGYGVYLSTNNGTNWIPVSNPAFNDMVQVDSSLFAGTIQGVFVSTDNGISWSERSNGLPKKLEDTSKYSFVSEITSCGNNLYAATPEEGIYLSTNNGNSWIYANGVEHGNCLASSGSDIFVGTGWCDMRCVPGSVYLFNNSSESWSDVGDGLERSVIFSMVVFGTDLFIANSNFVPSVWKRQLSEMITDVPPVAEELPRTFLLNQNYPNPFNPTTTISYQLPTQSYVTLKVFDVLGKEAATLVNGVEEPGYKSVTFDARKLSSGIYFYRLKSGNYFETKKLMLLK